MKNKLVALFACTLILFACATSENYTNKLNQEIGKTTEQLIYNYGNPSKVKKLANGDEIITYTSINYQVLPSPDYAFNTDFMTEDEIFYPFTYGGTDIPIGNFMGQIVEDYCKTDFYIKNNIVTSWQYKGNACVAM